MESTKVKQACGSSIDCAFGCPGCKTVPDNVAYCRGTKCDKMTTCSMEGACQYKSSAELLREDREARAKVLVESIDRELSFVAEDAEQVEMFPATVPVKSVKDFDGSITGGGYKASMDDPRKIPLSLIDPTFTDGIGRVLQHGARKYAPGNWMNGMSWREVIAGMKRHLSAIERGEDIDPETGELHTYHLACGDMFLSRYMNDPRYAEFDDRMFKGVPCQSR